MHFVTFEEAAKYLRGKSVAIVGSAPSVLDNLPGFVDSFDAVVRVNNYRTSEAAGFRCDMHYSFYGTSIRKPKEDLIADGVTLSWCKCPDSQPIESAWHAANGKPEGVDFRYIYAARRNWWFCDTVIPTDEEFLQKFKLLGNHIPTTGFSAILDVLACDPFKVYITGFDFFSSGKHNVNEPWRPGDPADPIGHRPQLERAWLADARDSYPLFFDKRLTEILAAEKAMA